MIIKLNVNDVSNIHKACILATVFMMYNQNVNANASNKLMKFTTILVIKKLNSYPHFSSMSIVDRIFNINYNLKRLYKFTKRFNLVHKN